MEHVDPHLQNNPGLRSRLENLEIAWEAAFRYIGQREMRDALDRAAAAVVDVQGMSHEVMRMCVECDPECFLVVPRIVLLNFVSEPTQDALLKSMLPHRFKKVDAGTSLKASITSEGLVALYRTIIHQLVKAQQPTSCHGKEIAKSKALEILKHRAIWGASWKSGKHDDVPTLAEDTHEAVERFMIELEGWSIELQRHCAADWNELVALLLQPHSENQRRCEQVKWCI
jgi:hypothetical protein